MNQPVAAVRQAPGVVLRVLHSDDRTRRPAELVRAIRDSR